MVSIKLTSTSTSLRCLSATSTVFQYVWHRNYWKGRHTYPKVTRIMTSKRGYRFTSCLQYMDHRQVSDSSYKYCYKHSAGIILYKWTVVIGDLGDIRNDTETLFWHPFWHFNILDVDKMRSWWLKRKAWFTKMYCNLPVGNITFAHHGWDNRFQKEMPYAYMYHMLS